MTTAPVSAGQVLDGKYRVERVLGAGGMGIVVAATHLHLDQRVALKFLLPDAMLNADVVARFAREARASASLRSEHVARVLDVGTLSTTGAPYMVMEYLEGTDLAQVLEARGALPIPEAIDYVLQACEALADAHVAGIVHRDLKPQNLFVTRRSDGSAVVKILDFGISKVTRASESEAAMTRTTAVMGSPYYMSPEQLKSSRDVDARSDLWSMGIILHEVLAGVVPYRAETMPQLCASILSDPPPPLRQVRPDAPAALEAIVLRCLQQDRARRFQSVSELATAIVPFGPPDGRIHAERIHRVIHASGLGGSAAQPAPSVVGGGIATDTAWAETAARSTGSTSGTSPLATTGANRGGSKFGAVAAAFGAVVLLGSVGIFLTSKKEQPVVAAQTAVAAPGETAKSPPPGAPLLIELRLSATPSAAKIFLDDAALPSNPYVTKIKADGSGHKVRFEAPGFRSQTHFVVFEKDTKLDFTLSPSEEPAAAPSQTPSAKAPSAKPATSGGAKRGLYTDPWKN